MAIVWMPWNLPPDVNAADRRAGFEYEYVSQSGNTSVVRWRIVAQAVYAGTYQFAFYTGIPLSGIIEKTFTSGQAGSTQALTSWANRNVEHDQYGTGKFTTWMIHGKWTSYQGVLSLTGEVYGGRTTISLDLPKINRIPGVPASITFATAPDKVSATSSVPTVNGAAPITDYEINWLSAGVWTGLAMNGRVGTHPAPGSFGVLTSYRARAKSVAGWGAWSGTKTYTPPALLGRRPDGAGEIVCQSAERYLGGGAWAPVTAVERFNGTAWAAPA